MIKTNKRFISIFICLLLFLFIVLFSNISLVMNNCLETYDFGLYQQAIYGLADGQLNPYISVRGLNIFNDHFEPILFLPALLISIFGYSSTLLILFEWAIFALFIFLANFLANKEKSQEKLLFIFASAVFTKGILTGLVFPVHPNVWAMIPLLFLVHGLFKNHFLEVAISSLSLFLFRESYPYAVFGLSAYYLFNKRWKEFFIILSISVFGIFLVQKGRVLLFGEYYDYGKAFIHSLTTRPFEYLIERSKVFEYKSLFKIYYPFIIPITYLLKIGRNKKILSHPFFAVFTFLGPLLFLHFLANKFHYQYGTTFVVPLLAMIYFSKDLNGFLKNNKMVYLTLFLFMASSSSSYTRFIKYGILKKIDRCIMTPDKRQATLELKKYFKKNIPIKKTIFSSKRIIPSLMQPGRQFYVSSNFSTYLDSFDYILMEKNFGGDRHSLTEGHYEEMKKRCFLPKNEILLDDKYFVLVKGPIAKPCYSYFFYM